MVTLEEALAGARTRSEQFAIVDEQLIQARTMRTRAWAALMPMLSANGTLTHSDKEIAFNNRLIQKQNAYAGNIQATLTLLRPSAFAGIVEANRRANAAAAQTAWTKNDLAFEVTRAYVSALSAKAFVTAAEHSVHTSRQHLAAVRARRNVGKALGVDETRAKLELVTAIKSSTRAANAHASAVDYLCYLIGMDPPIALETPNQPSIYATDPRVENAKPEFRPDVRAAALEADAEDASTAQSWLDWLPSLHVVGTYRGTENTGFSGDPYSWNAVLVAEWILFDGGYRCAETKESASKARAARLKQQLQKRLATLEVRQALRDLQTGLVNLEAAKEQLQLATSTQSMVLEQYRAGLANSLELVEADDALSQAESNNVVESLAVDLARLELLRAVGLTPEGEEIETP